MFSHFTFPTFSSFAFSEWLPFFSHSFSLACGTWFPHFRNQPCPTMQSKTLLSLYHMSETNADSDKLLSRKQSENKGQCIAQLPSRLNCFKSKRSGPVENYIMQSVEVCYKNKSGLGKISRLHVRCIIVLPLSRHVDRFCSVDQGKIRKVIFRIDIPGKRFGNTKCILRNIALYKCFLTSFHFQKSLLVCKSWGW